MAIIEFMKKHKSDNEMSMLYAGLWSGLITNDYVKSIETDYTFEEVCEWCEVFTAQEKTSIMEKISDALMKTQDFKSYVTETDTDKTEEDKKKV